MRSKTFIGFCSLFTICACSTRLFDNRPLTPRIPQSLHSRKWVGPKNQVQLEKWILQQRATPINRRDQLYFVGKDGEVFKRTWPKPGIRRMGGLFGVKSILLYRDNLFALTEGGELYNWFYDENSWNKLGEGVEQIITSSKKGKYFLYLTVDGYYGNRIKLLVKRGRVLEKKIMETGFMELNRGVVRHELKIESVVEQEDGLTLIYSDRYTRHYGHPHIRDDISTRKIAAITAWDYSIDMRGKGVKCQRPRSNEDGPESMTHLWIRKDKGESMFYIQYEKDGFLINRNSSIYTSSFRELKLSMVDALNSSDTFKTSELVNTLMAVGIKCVISLSS